MIEQKPIRPKKCRGCGNKFQPVRPLQIACKPECAYKVARENGAKERRKIYQADKAKLKTRSDWLKEAQAAVNKYVRLRDNGKPCISCERHHQGQWHAGHYRSIGANPELRFDENNIYRQCAPCNSHLSGNLINYRIGLIKRAGISIVEWLEGPHEAKHYTIDDLKGIKAKYSKMAKDIENGKEH